MVGQCSILFLISNLLSSHTNHLFRLDSFYYRIDKAKHAYLDGMWLIMMMNGRRLKLKLIELLWDGTTK